MAEVQARFGVASFKRRTLFTGLEAVVAALQLVGVDHIWLDGSFVSSKERPGDVDVVYEVPAGADPYTWGMLSPHPAQRKRLKDLRKVDLWPLPSPQPVPGAPGRSRTILEMFEEDRNGRAKGVIALT
jgi:hypothetical protein